MQPTVGAPPPPPPSGYPDLGAPGATGGDSHNPVQKANPQQKSDFSRRISQEDAKALQKEYDVEMPQAVLPTLQKTVVNTKSFHAPPQLSQKEMQKLLKDWKETQGCCYQEWPIDKIDDTSYDVQAAYDYTLRSFTETREITNEYKPYQGGPVDDCHQGVVPGMWDLPIGPDAMFCNCTKSCTVPHTSMVTSCMKCHATGLVQCKMCDGKGQHTCPVCYGRRQISCRAFGCLNGRKTCMSCSGTGTTGYGDNKRTCFSCNGMGRQQCRECLGRGYEDCYRCRNSGGVNANIGGINVGLGSITMSTGMVPCQPCNQTGKVTCGKCEGFRALLYYKLLTCDFKIRKSTHVIKYSKGLDDRVVSRCSGMSLLSFRAPAVDAINDFPETAVNQVSQQLVIQHGGYHGGSTRILMQEHKLDAIPIHEVRVQGDSPWKFWIVGNEKRVVVNDYPATCCCVIS